MFLPKSVCKEIYMYINIAAVMMLYISERWNFLINSKCYN